MSEYGNYTRTVTLLLEDVTAEIADEFFANGADLSATLGDGLEYVASIEAVASDKEDQDA